jgi:hypothetical protein
MQKSAKHAKLVKKNKHLFIEWKNPDRFSSKGSTTKLSYSIIE